jgi:hypothetical protein
VREHEFENLILLCAVCHARAGTKEIDIHEMRAYKVNLGVVASRYGDLERRVLEKFVKDSELEEVVIDRSHEVLLEYLLADGLIADVGPANGAIIARPANGSDLAFTYGPSRWRLTEHGRFVVDRLRRAKRVD